MTVCPYLLLNRQGLAKSKQLSARASIIFVFVRVWTTWYLELKPASLAFPKNETSRAQSRQWRTHGLGFLNQDTYVKYCGGNERISAAALHLAKPKTYNTVL